MYEKVKAELLKRPGSEASPKPPRHCTQCAAYIVCGMLEKKGNTNCLDFLAALARLKMKGTRADNMYCPHLDNIGGCCKSVRHEKCTCGYENLRFFRLILGGLKPGVKNGM